MTTTAAACGKSLVQPVTISDWKLGGAPLSATTGASIAKLAFTGEEFCGVPYGGQREVTIDFASQHMVLGGTAG